MKKMLFRLGEYFNKLIRSCIQDPFFSYQRYWPVKIGYVWIKVARSRGNDIEDFYCVQEIFTLHLVQDDRLHNRTTTYNVTLCFESFKTRCQRATYDWCQRPVQQCISLEKPQLTRLL